jgi:hypothetical protein
MPWSLLLASLLAVPLEWTAPPECPDGDAARRLVEAELASLPAELLAELSVEGTVLPSTSGYRLEVLLRRPDATIARVVGLDDCSTAAEALALVVAIAIDPSRSGDGESEDPPSPEPEPLPFVEPEPEPAPEPEPLPLVEPPLAEPEPPEPAPLPARRRTVPRVAIRASGGLGVGVLPRLGAQVGGEVAAVWRRARVGVQVEHWVRRSSRLDDPSTAGADLSLTSARVVGGPIFAWRRLEVPLVAFGGLGAVRARGVGVSAAVVRSVLWAELGAAAGVQWFVRPWLGFGAQAELVVPLVRHGFYVSETRLVTRTGPVAGVFRAGIELRFP